MDVAAQALKDSDPLVNKRNTYQSSQSFRNDVRQSRASRMFALVVSFGLHSSRLTAGTVPVASRAGEKWNTKMIRCSRSQSISFQKQKL